MPFSDLCFMKKICLISDTHSYMGNDVLDHCLDSDEIWHAGDVGGLQVIDQLLQTGKTLRAVYGNIDNAKIRADLDLNLHFECEGVSVFMTHIGSYPGRYTKRVKALLEEHKPDLYICGHSHICKVMWDKKLELLHMNPGACGHKGFHRFRTILKFDCVDSEVKNLRVVELGHRGQNLLDQESA